MDQTMQFEVLHPGVQAAVKEDGQSSFPVCPADRRGAGRRLRAGRHTLFGRRLGKDRARADGDTGGAWREGDGGLKVGSEPEPRRGARGGGCGDGGSRGSAAGAPIDLQHRAVDAPGRGDALGGGTGRAAGRPREPALRHRPSRGVGAGPTRVAGTEAAGALLPRERGAGTVGGHRAA